MDVTPLIVDIFVKKKTLKNGKNQNPKFKVQNPKFKVKVKVNIQDKIKIKFKAKVKTKDFY
jgi:hypothetical protein